MTIIRRLIPKPISQYHPLFYFLSTRTRRALRYWQWKTDGQDYAQEKCSTPLPYRVKKHQSVLIRKLGDSEQHWQHNKVINLNC